MFASTIGSLQWPATTAGHWSGAAMLYSSVVLAICTILTGAQQTLVLVSADSISELGPSEIQEIRASLASRTGHERPRPSAFAVFSWQVPLMLLCYCILCFLAGLCSIVYSPLSKKLAWSSDLKVCCMYSSPFNDQ